MTTEHFRPLLDSEEDCEKFWFFCQTFAQARVPDEVLSAVRMGRITAQKPSGGIRGGRFSKKVGVQNHRSRLGQLSRSPQRQHQYAMSFELGANPLHICCRPGRTKIIVRQCSQLTALEHSTWCLVSPCFGVCRVWREVTGCCRSSDNSTGHFQHPSGKMKKASSTTSHKGKAGNKGMR